MLGVFIRIKPADLIWVSYRPTKFGIQLSECDFRNNVKKQNTHPYNNNNEITVITRNLNYTNFAIQKYATQLLILQ